MILTINVTIILSIIMYPYEYRYDFFYLFGWEGGVALNFLLFLFFLISDMVELLPARLKDLVLLVIGQENGSRLMSS